MNEVFSATLGQTFLLFTQTSLENLLKGLSGFPDYRVERVA